jgi:3-phosphoshikimate 1-carboxyvinyltransferase
LRAVGVSVLHEGLTARFEVDGGSLKGGTVRIRGEKSSQFLSSMLLVGSYADTGIHIEVDGVLASPVYVDLTVSVMKAFGVRVERIGANGFHVAPHQRYRRTEYAIEADASAASYGFGAAAITAGEVTVAGTRRQSLQADSGFAEILQRMGCHVQESDRGVNVAREGTLRGTDIDMHGMPDVVPTLAVVALFAEGTTRIRNVAHLRYKESDRLQALSGELKKTGATIVELEDGLDITPTRLHGAQLDPRSDHRLAMSFALIGLRVPGIRIANPGCVKKSFPRYWDELEKLTSH